MHLRIRAGNGLRIAIGLLLLFCLLPSCGQAIPYLDWQRCLWDGVQEEAYSIQQTEDGGYVSAGEIIPYEHFPPTGYVVKLDASGRKVWRTRLGGGEGTDKAYSIQQTAGGGYIVACTTNSYKDHMSGNHGGYDYWVVKLDASGKLVWQKCLGGKGKERAQCIQQTSDGGYIVAGSTNTKDGDVRGNHGGYDYWVVKLDASGKLVWQKCLGGSKDEYAQSVRQTSDGGYIVAGSTNSKDGDVRGNHGSSDCWVVKLDTSGKLVWQRCLGGSDVDEARSIQQTSDGGYIVAGYAWSSDDDVRGNHGSSDCWVVKLDASGKLVWQRCLGGSNIDKASSIQQTSDGGYIVAGRTDSHDGDAPGCIAHGTWIVKLGDIDCTLTAPDLVCSGSTDNVASTKESGAEYHWFIDNGTITSSNDSQSITFTAGASGPLSLSVYVNKKGSWDHCYKDIPIEPMPCCCSWTSNAPVCNGTPVQFTGPAGMDSYQWEFGDGQFSLEEDPSYLYPHPGIHRVQLTVTKLGLRSSCRGTIEIKPLPDCRWISSSPVCNGTPVQFTGPAGMDSYYWDFGNGAVSSAQGASHLYSAPGTYSVNLTVAKGGCPNNCTGTVEVRPRESCKRPPNIEWQRCLGGSDWESAESVQQTADGGYIVAGRTYSNDGDVSGNHGIDDFWVVKLDASGNMTWQKCLGGSSWDEAYDIQQTADGGYIVAGWAFSNDGDVSGNHGTDLWVVKLDASGNMAWQRCLGGSGWDIAYSIQQTADDGYIVAGHSRSNDGDVSGNHGIDDFWVVKLDASGNMTWQRCLGGSGTDDAYSIQQVADGGYVVAGITDTNNNGDVSGNHGSFDCWIVKLDRYGNLLWQKCLGGSDEDRAESVQQTADGGYIVAGRTFSNDGDASGNHGERDGWVVKLDASGNRIWQRCLGGSQADEGQSIQQTADGEYLVAGYTCSSDGDVSGNHGSEDFWIVKLAEISCTITAPDAVYSGSTGNAASTAESGASYAWSIANGAITSASDTRSISFTTGISGTTRLTVNVTKKGSWSECHKDIAIKPRPGSSLAPDQAALDSPAEQPSERETREGDGTDGQASSREKKVRIYPVYSD